MRLNSNSIIIINLLVASFCHAPVLMAFELSAAPPSVCFLTYARTEKDKYSAKEQVSCSGTLVAKKIIVTAAHCLPADGPSEIKGQYLVGCGIQSQNQGKGGSFVFAEEFTVNGVRTSTGRNTASYDYAFLRLDHEARRIAPMRVPTNQEAFQHEFLIRSPFTESEDYMFKSSIECRFSGYGLDKSKKRNWFVTSDQSPSNGLRGYKSGSGIAIEGWGDEIGKLRKGDSGGPLYCRVDQGAEWALVAILSAGNLDTRTTWAATASDEFLSLWRSVLKEWK